MEINLGPLDLDRKNLIIQGVRRSWKHTEEYGHKPHTHWMKIEHFKDC